MPRLTVVIAGLGHQGRRHLANCLRSNNVQLVGVCDSSPKALTRVKSLGLRTYLDFEIMVKKEDPDAVIVAVPNSLHGKCAISAAEAGCDIFIEKPLALSVAEGLGIRDSVRRSGVRLMIGMQQRFIPDIQKMKRTIEDGLLGQIQFALGMLFTRGPFQGRVPEWWFDPSKTGGGALFDSGSHLVDLMIWFFGDPVSLSSRFEQKYNLGFDDHAELDLRFGNNTSGKIVVSWQTRIPTYRVEIVGECGSVTARNLSNIHEQGLLRAGVRLMSQVIPRIVTGRSAWPLGEEEYYRELEYFFSALRSGEEPTPSVDEGLKVLQVMELAYGSPKRPPETVRMIADPLLTS